MGIAFSSIKPPVIYQTFLAVMLVGKLALWPTAAPIFASWVPGIGAGMPLFLAGAKVALSSKNVFKRTGTPMMGGPGPASPLHTSGAFALTRNPMYLGISIALCGAALASNCAWHLLFPLANSWIMNRYYIPNEERQLEKKFGEEYRRYKQRVRRWL